MRLALQRKLSPESIASLFEELRECLLTVDSAGVVRGLWSSNRAQLHDLEARVLGHPLKDAMSVETFAWIEELITRAVESGAVAESRYAVELEDGRHTFSVSVMPVAQDTGGARSARILTRDITRETKNLERLQHSEALLDQAEELAEMCSWDYDLVANKVTWSAQLGRVFGLGGNGEAVDGEIFWQFVHPEDREQSRKDCARRIAEGRPFEHVTRFLVPGGRIRTFYTRAKPVMDSGGRAVRLVGVSQDVTERRESEIKLREREALLAQAEQVGNLGSWQLDFETGVFTRSENLCRMMGVAPSEATITEDAFWETVDPEDREIVRSAIERGMKNGQPYEYQARLMLPDGSRRTFLTRGKAISDATGRVIKRVGVTLDVTERAEAEHALEESEERYRDLVENSHDLICTHDLEGRVLSMNELPARILGYRPEDIIGRHIPEMLDPEVRDEFGQYIERIQRDGFAKGLMGLRTRAGERRIWEFHNTLRRRGVPAPIVRGMARDITEQWVAERKLRKSQSLLAQAEQLADIGSWELDVATNTLNWSSHFFRMLGLEPEEGPVEGGRGIRIIHPDDRERGIRDADSLKAGADSFENELRFVLADGSVRTFHSRGVAVRDASGQLETIRGMSQDITERAEAERKLRESQALLAQAEQLANVGSWEADIGTATAKWSAHFYRMLGLEPVDAPIPIERVIQMVHPDDREWSNNDIHGLIAGRSELDHETRFLASDGSARIIHSRGVADRDESGRVIRLRGMAQDVTEQREAENKLRASQALLAQAEKIANFGSWEHDLARDKILISDHLRQMYGFASADEWTEEIYWERVHPKDRERVREVTSRAGSLREPCSFVSRYVRPDGGVRVHFSQGIPVLSAEGKVVRWIGVIQDITDQTRSEEELRRLTQELMRARDDDRRHMARELHASAGQSLAALKMSLGRLRSELPEKQELVHELLNSAIELADGAIREVRTVSYLMHPPMLDEAGLASALRWYADGFAKRSGIRVRVEVPEDFGRHSQEIETTVFRIVQEALTNVHRYSGSRTATIRLEAAKGKIRAEVRDEGCGLPSVTQMAGSRAPLGVGIASMRERVKLLNGIFEIESAPGSGTTVRVILPMTEDLRPAALVHEMPHRKIRVKAKARKKVKDASRR